MGFVAYVYGFMVVEGSYGCRGVVGDVTVRDCVMGQLHMPELTSISPLNLGISKCFRYMAITMLVANIVLEVY